MRCSGELVSIWVLSLAAATGAGLAAAAGAAAAGRAAAPAGACTVAVLAAEAAAARRFLCMGEFGSIWVLSEFAAAWLAAAAARFLCSGEFMSICVRSLLLLLKFFSSGIFPSSRARFPGPIVESRRD